VRDETFTAVKVNRVARLVSWIGHPLVFVTVSVIIVVTAELTLRAAWPVVAVLLLAVILPTAILLYLGVRSGQWQDADVSVREQRRRFYPRAIPISAVGVLVSYLTGAPWFIIKGSLVTLGLFIVAAIVNRRMKISLHAIFAFFCATILFRVNFFWGLAALALALLVFWSRLNLKRHVPAEMIAGTVLGVCGGIMAAWLPGS